MSKTNHPLPDEFSVDLLNRVPKVVMAQLIASLWQESNDPNLLSRWVTTEWANLSLGGQVEAPTKSLIQKYCDEEYQAEYAKAILRRKQDHESAVTANYLNYLLHGKD